MWDCDLRVYKRQVYELQTEQFTDQPINLLRGASRINLHIISSLQIRKSKRNFQNFNLFNNNSWLNSRYTPESICEIYCHRWK